MARALPSDPLAKQVLVALVEKLALPGELRQRALRLSAAAEADEEPDHVEDAIDALAGVILEARGRIEADMRAAGRFLLDLEEDHRELARKAEALAGEVRDGFGSREAFDEAMRAEAEGMRLTADEVLDRASSVKRAIDVGVVGIFGTLEAQEEEERRRRAVVEKGLTDLLGEISSLEGAIRNQAGELRAAATATFADELTGCPNRLAYQERVAAEHAGHRKRGTPLCLLCLGLDGLAETNAAFGHAAGDQVIRVIAKIAAKAVEPAGSLSRHGGGEFVAILPGAELPEALARGEEIRKAVACFRFLSKGERIPISLSAGVADFRNDDPPDDVFRRAYRALKLARDRGGNIVATDRNLKEG
ncbi:MAG: GGDEF domain-containing protein [Deltaproteobacteria bacterium]|nr:GGDEF domain-containing protein [Deltaproteobacteria bacterium]